MELITAVRDSSRTSQDVRRNARIAAYEVPAESSYTSINRNNCFEIYALLIRKTKKNPPQIGILFWTS